MIPPPAVPLWVAWKDESSIVLSDSNDAPAYRPPCTGGLEGRILDTVGASDDAPAYRSPCERGREGFVWAVSIALCGSRFSVNNVPFRRPKPRCIRPPVYKGIDLRQAVNPVHHVYLSDLDESGAV